MAKRIVLTEEQRLGIRKSLATEYTYSMETSEVMSVGGRKRIMPVPRRKRTTLLSVLRSGARRYCYGHGITGADADDTVQETVLRVWADPSPYVRRVTKIGDARKAAFRCGASIARNVSSDRVSVGRPDSWTDSTGENTFLKDYIPPRKGGVQSLDPSQESERDVKIGARPRDALSWSRVTQFSELLSRLGCPELAATLVASALGWSPKLQAEALGCEERTIRYRLERIKTVLGGARATAAGRLAELPGDLEAGQNPDCVSEAAASCLPEDPTRPGEYFGGAPKPVRRYFRQNNAGCLMGLAVRDNGNHPPTDNDMSCQACPEWLRLMLSDPDRRRPLGRRLPTADELN